MNILLYSGLQINSPGGIGSWTEQYISYLSDKENIKCYLINTAVVGKRVHNLEKYNLISEIRRLSEIKKQVRDALSKKIDVAHFNSSCSYLGVIRDSVILKSIRKKGIPYVIHFHCDLAYQINRWPKFIKQIVIKLLKKIIMNAEERIVLNSPSLLFLQKTFESNGILVPNFLKIESAIGSHKIINEKLQSILFVGHVTKEKGFFELIEVAKHLKNIIFNVIGEANQQILVIVRDIENIKMLGQKSHQEVFEQLFLNDVFILPSYSEGFSIALLEAMSVGIPCIASDVGANSEMLEGEGGIILKELTPECIISSIMQIEEQTRRSKMSAWNINKVEKCYSVGVVMELLISIYTNIIHSMGKE